MNGGFSFDRLLDAWSTRSDGRIWLIQDEQMSNTLDVLQKNQRNITHIIISKIIRFFFFAFWCMCVCNSQAKVDGSLNIDSIEAGSNPYTDKERNAYT